MEEIEITYDIYNLLVEIRPKVKTWEDLYRNIEKSEETHILQFMTFNWVEMVREHKSEQLSGNVKEDIDFIIDQAFEFALFSDFAYIEDAPCNCEICEYYND